MATTPAPVPPLLSTDAVWSSGWGTVTVPVWMVPLLPSSAISGSPLVVGGEVITIGGETIFV